MSRFVNPNPKFTDTSNDVLSNGLLFFFETGTNTDKATFADANEQTANTQPLVLNADGTTPNCFYTGVAKVVLTTNDGTVGAPIQGTQIWERDPVTAAQIASFGEEWDATIIYTKDDVVVSNNVFYISNIDSNQNKNPATTATAWSQFDFLERWNTNKSYKIGDPTTHNNRFYASLIDSNVGNEPGTNSTSWKSTQEVTTQTFTASGTWTKPTGCQTIIVEVIGGGGGAAGSLGDSSGSFGGGGGGGGGTAIIRLDAGALTSETVTVGAGGAGGSGDADGVAGGSSSLGTLCVATGGALGARPSGGTAPPKDFGALGGIGTTGDQLIAGQPGENHFIISLVTSGPLRAPFGGSSSKGAGAPGRTNEGAGQAGRDYGGGGSGAYNPATNNDSNTGGAGADGLVVVTEFY